MVRAGETAMKGGPTVRVTTGTKVLDENFHEVEPRSGMVGVPDERWGSTVATVVRLREGRETTFESIQAHCQNEIAGYKVPRRLHIVDRIIRSPSGKPDYRWAAEVAAPWSTTEGDHFCR